MARPKQSKAAAFSVGELVFFTAVLERDKSYNGPVLWVSHPCERRRGWYMGQRTVYEGDHRRGSEGSAWHDGEPACLLVARGISHALVVFDPRKAPIRIPWDALEKPPAETVPTPDTTQKD